MLSLTCGIRAQIFRMEAKIRAFFAAGMRGGEVMGRNSATGSPRRSITIMPPPAASRTNSDVRMWSSRTEVFLTMLHCSTSLKTARLFLRSRRRLGSCRVNAEIVPWTPQENHKTILSIVKGDIAESTIFWRGGR